VASVDEKFKALDELLETHRAGDGFKLYTELSEDDVKALAAAVDALGEPISNVAEVVSR
jgi:iron uptake system component EfeO